MRLLSSSLCGQLIVREVRGNTEVEISQPCSHWSLSTSQGLTRLHQSPCCSIPRAERVISLAAPQPWQPETQQPMLTSTRKGPRHGTSPSFSGRQRWPPSAETQTGGGGQGKSAAVTHSGQPHGQSRGERVRHSLRQETTDVHTAPKPNSPNWPKAKILKNNLGEVRELGSEMKGDHGQRQTRCWQSSDMNSVTLL